MTDKILFVRPPVLNRFVVISGLPASGKSTLGRAIAGALRLPMLDKDEILEELFDRFGVGNSEWRSNLSRVADETLRRQACALPNAVITSWWRHPRSSAESGTPTDWLSSLPGDLVELHCVCSPSVAANRFVARKRHVGHLDSQRTHAALYAGFEQLASLGPLAVGRVVQVSTETVPQLAEVLDRMACPPRQQTSHEPTKA